MGTIKDWQPKKSERFVMDIANPKVKQTIVESMKRKGAEFTSVIHLTAKISDFAEAGEGLVMDPNTVITVNTRIGE
ncbi:hypothetical protein [Succiniclasticum ruminis]|uniref:hypothetical protein n=1 Tax=Succiniclasticum ruminis TaxID=40841 RepID=UPI00115FD07A|nr:hypothetical protein [Succiniclasticum ruminis]